MRIFIDADILVYRAGFAAQKKQYKVTTEGGVCYFKTKRETDQFTQFLDEDHMVEEAKTIEEWWMCRGYLESMINRIYAAMSARYKGIKLDYYAYLTSNDKSNFRFSLTDDYKATRAKVSKPYHYEAIRQYLVDMFNAIMVTGEEADDAISIAMMKDYRGGVIVTLDKDLDMIPGMHYNFVKDTFTYIEEADAIKWFYKQLLMGDTADNIKGIRGIGPKTADKLLSECTDEGELWETALQTWVDYHPDLTSEEVLKKVIMTGQLLWMRRKENQMWAPPNKEGDNE